MADTSFRIILMGTPDFAVPALHKLLNGPDHVVAVVTQPDRPKGRGKKLTPPPIKVAAAEAGIPVLQPTKIRTEEFLNTLKSYQPDLIIVAAYGRMLPASILDLPRLGCINIHGSLLPRHRGAAPIQWAVIKGDSQAGVTIMQMDVGMDTGDILLPAAIPVAEDETAGSLFHKLAELGGTTLLQALDLLRQDKLISSRQDHSLATEAPPLTKEDGRLDWNRPAAELHCLIRGLDPWPGAYSFVDGQRFRFFAPEIIHKECRQAAGTLILADHQGLLIATAQDCLLIKEIQPEGKKRMTVEAYLCGHPLAPGLQLTRE
ncbi:MAG: methionyl-tRNA formyltransferase [Proteobacteria bacterium]|jgi:methionyl-tRNA formyltransferase|nr:methionyl-tRNA formyltransferase [Desulfocapsa sp.]MBU3945364.1 methionyl-tRNA formyltransferase [Pseudomonadota bacterium]MCG2743312.1 methionyl-tRNA formyltransferase [Desulfobacteraceae bacterium]MBU3984843.1 methionyl-tRNA formyltransferase [Pseudomonadota bacterium]MBU4029347.1 methionyl-tRNA formyltransferase [Pseudomonadota bacterium]